jgi:hypothetical protein
MLPTPLIWLEDLARTSDIVKEVLAVPGFDSLYWITAEPLLFAISRFFTDRRIAIQDVKIGRYAFVLPVGSGKTTISMTTGFFDIDAFNPPDFEMRHSLVVAGKSSWSDFNAWLWKQQSLVLPRSGVILLHSAEQAHALGATVLGTYKPLRAEIAQLEDPVRRKLAVMNWNQTNGRSMSRDEIASALHDPRYLRLMATKSCDSINRLQSDLRMERDVYTSLNPVSMETKGRLDSIIQTVAVIRNLFPWADVSGHRLSERVRFAFEPGSYGGAVLNSGRLSYAAPLTEIVAIGTTLVANGADVMMGPKTACRRLAWMKSLSARFGNDVAHIQICLSGDCLGRMNGHYVFSSGHLINGTLWSVLNDTTVLPYLLRAFAVNVDEGSRFWESEYEKGVDVWHSPVDYIETIELLPYWLDAYGIKGVRLPFELKAFKNALLTTPSKVPSWELTEPRGKLVPYVAGVPSERDLRAYEEFVAADSDEASLFARMLGA